MKIEKRHILLAAGIGLLAANGLMADIAPWPSRNRPHRPAHIEEPKPQPPPKPVEPKPVAPKPGEPKPGEPKPPVNDVHKPQPPNVQPAPPVPPKPQPPNGPATVRPPEPPPKPPKPSLWQRFKNWF